MLLREIRNSSITAENRTKEMELFIANVVLLYLEHENAGYPVKFEIQINNEQFLSISVSQILHGAYLY